MVAILYVELLASFTFFRTLSFVFYYLVFNCTIISILSIYFLSMSFCFLSMNSGSCSFKTLSFSLNSIKLNVPLVLMFVCLWVFNDSYPYGSSFSLTVANFIWLRIFYFMSYCFQYQSLFIVLVMALLLLVLLVVIFVYLMSMLCIMYCLDSTSEEFSVGLVFSIIC